jgi:hypothetical protein
MYELYTLAHQRTYILGIAFQIFLWKFVFEFIYYVLNVRKQLT